MGDTDTRGGTEWTRVLICQPKSSSTRMHSLDVCLKAMPANSSVTLPSCVSSILRKSGRSWYIAVHFTSRDAGVANFEQSRCRVSTLLSQTAWQAWSRGGSGPDSLNSKSLKSLGPQVHIAMVVTICQVMEKPMGLLTPWSLPSDDEAGSGEISTQKVLEQIAAA